jgi:hypothetical protein
MHFGMSLVIRPATAANQNDWVDSMSHSKSQVFRNSANINPRTYRRVQYQFISARSES